MNKLGKLSFLLVLPLLTPWAGSNASEQNSSAANDKILPFRLSGWTEVVQSVSNLDRHRAFMEEVAGWKVIDAGTVDADTLRAWKLDPTVNAEQILMANAGTKRGFLRLVRFDNTEKTHIRSNAQPWESGGIFDINFRVRDMDANFKEFQSHDWRGFSDPVHYSFGPFEVKEWIAVGPDGLAFALIERIKPELEGWPTMLDISRAFNSTQIVSDMEASLSFYRDILGFRKYLYWKGVSEEPGPSVLGLPAELTTQIEREVWILHPEGLNEGSVELVQFKGLSGRDLSKHAVPPNLGMLMLRFPVDNLDALITHLKKNGVATEGDISVTRLAPWGKARQVSVRAPDGAWLDFYEENRVQ